MKIALALRAGLLALTCVGIAHAPAHAVDKLKVALPQKGSWGTMFAEMAASQGFLKEQGIEATYLYTTGGTENLQTLTTGGVDIVAPASAWAVITAFAKGSPVRIIASDVYGLPDILWYVKTDSPIKGPADLKGKKIAYSRPASVTHMGVSAYLDYNKVEATLISAGSASATRTMVFTGQLDVGYTVVPLNLDIVRKGEIRILFSGNGSPEMKGVARTVMVTSAKHLAERRDVIRRYMTAHHKTVDWVYRKNPDAAIKQFAADNKIDPEVARDVLKYFKYEYHAPTPIHGLETMVKQAVAYKLIDKPLTPAQMKELVDIAYDPGKS